MCVSAYATVYVCIYVRVCLCVCVHVCWWIVFLFVFTESQLMALREVQAVGEPCFSRALEMGLSATGGCKDFTGLDTEHSHFLLKQQQKQLSVMPGKFCICSNVMLLFSI